MLPNPDDDEEEKSPIWGIGWKKPEIFNRSIDMYTLSISYRRTDEKYVIKVRYICKRKKEKDAVC